jgi:hypothetical protein
VCFLLGFENGFYKSQPVALGENQKFILARKLRKMKLYGSIIGE